MLSWYKHMVSGSSHDYIVENMCNNSIDYPAVCKQYNELNDFLHRRPLPFGFGRLAKAGLPHLVLSCSSPWHTLCGLPNNLPCLGDEADYLWALPISPTL